MINIFCLWTGNKYPLEYVTKLQSMVKRKLSQEHRFICLTDKPNLHKIEGIEFKQAPVAIADSWCKLSLFTPKIAEEFKGEIAFYLDLDVVLVSKLDSLVEDADLLKLNTIKDWWREGINSSVMIWKMGKFTKIYNSFKPSDMNRLRGDQDLINEKLGEEEVNYFDSIDVQSYKANNLQDKVNPKTKIVVFHGKPKPNEVGGWVDNYWK
jgi:hypothetical protein